MTNPPELLSAAEAVIADRDAVGFLPPGQYGASERWLDFTAAVTAARNAPAIPADDSEMCNFLDRSLQAEGVVLTTDAIDRIAASIRNVPQPPADTVTIERRTEAEWLDEVIGNRRSLEWARGVGLIKPDPDPYAEHLSKHGLTDTVEARAMFDSFQEKVS